jgi:hypothetical protein
LYHRRVRGIPATRAWKKHHKSYEGFEVFRFDWETLRQHAIKVAGDLQRSKVISLNTDEKWLRTMDFRGGMADFNYNQLISTIPRPTFCAVTSQPVEDLQWFSIFIKHHRDYTSRWVVGSDIFKTPYNYVYVIEEDIDSARAYRLTKINWSMLTGFWAEYMWEVRGSRCLKYGKIVSGKPTPVKDVEFVGRYSEWKPNLKLHDVWNSLR